LSNSSKALVLLDLQNEMVHADGALGRMGLAKIVAERQVLENTRRALDAARAGGVAVVHVGLGFREDYADALSRAPRIERMKRGKIAVAGTWGSEFHQLVAPAEGEVVFVKQSVNPFVSTNIANWLQARGVRELYLAGVATHMVVEATVRHADDIGLVSCVLEDCCAGPNPEWHEHSIKNIIPAFGRAARVDAFLDEIGTRR